MSDYPSPVPEPRAGAAAPPISRDIYGMPAFTTLVAADIARTIAWYTEALDFVELFAVPGPDGTPVLVHLRRWRFQDLLVRPSADEVGPGSSMSLGLAAVYDELDELAVRARRVGGGSVDGPIDTRWNTRDLMTTDPDGNLVTFTAGRPPELQDAAFAQVIAKESERQRMSGDVPDDGSTGPRQPDVGGVSYHSIRGTDTRDRSALIGH